MSNLKVILVQAPPLGKVAFSAPPLGLGYIASFLIKKGLKNVKILDYSNTNIKNAIKEIKKLKFNVAGFSVNQRNYFSSIKIAKSIKKQSVKIIFGGYHPSLMIKEVIKEKPVDYVVIGEGEKIFYKLLKKLEENQDIENINGIAYKKKGKIFISYPKKNEKNLDVFPAPIRKLDNNLKNNKDKKRIGTIISSRGCPYNCKICSIHSFYSLNKKNILWRKRSPKKVIDEIEDLIKSKNIKEIAFIDDNFLVNKKHAKQISEEIKKRKLKLNFWIMTRPDDIIKNKDILPLLKEAGCTKIDVGLESGNNAQLKRYGKKLTIEENEKSIEILKKLKIPFNPYFICFDPKLKLKELNDNILFLKKNNLFKIDLVYSWFEAIPGTKYYKRLSNEKNLFGSKHRPYYHFENENIEKIFSLLDYFVKLSKKNVAPTIKKLNKSILNKKIKKERYIELNFEKKYIELIFQIFFEKITNIRYLKKIKLTNNYLENPTKTIKFRNINKSVLKKWKKYIENNIEKKNKIFKKYHANN